MAAPVASYAQLPDDSGNGGKKLRTQTRVVGSDTVHEQIMVRVRQALLLGVYRAAMAQQAIVAAATNGTTTGLLWGHMPTAVTNKKARIRRIKVDTQHSTVLATPTAPRLLIQRMTFTGTASGGSVTATKVDASSAAAVFDLRSAVTGLTPSLVGGLGSIGVCGALTAVGAYAPAPGDLFCYDPEEDGWNVFAPGEGFVIYQDTAGTSSDTRQANISLLWDEIDTA